MCSSAFLTKHCNVFEKAIICGKCMCKVEVLHLEGCNWQKAFKAGLGAIQIICDTFLTPYPMLTE